MKIEDAGGKTGPDSLRASVDDDRVASPDGLVPDEDLERLQDAARGQSKLRAPLRPPDPRC